MKEIKITTTKVITKIKWFMTNYPVGTMSYYELQTESGEVVSTGTVNIPQEIIDVWGTDDSVIENYIIESLAI